MNQEVKRRIVMSLVSLALAFGLLATYYIVTVPWNRTAVGQALTAGSILGIAALVMQFMPIRAPVPAAASQQQPAQVPQVPPAQRWQPEPEFAAEDFQADLVTAPPVGSEAASVLASPVSIAAPVARMAQTAFVEPAPMPPPEIVPPPAPAPRIVLPMPAASLNNAPMTPEHLEKVIEAADEEAASDALSLAEIKDSGEVLMVRNDHVRVDASVEAVPLAPVIVQAYREEPARTAAPSVAAKPIIAAPKPIAAPTKPAAAARSPQARQSPKSEWREPDPETPKELLRELAEYWHVKYETERKRHSEVLTQYEDVVRRLEVLETSAPVELSGNGASPGIDDQLPLDEMSVADAVVHEGKNELEDRWDRRAAQMERFH